MTETIIERVNVIYHFLLLSNIISVESEQVELKAK